MAKTPVSRLVPKVPRAPKVPPVVPAADAITGGSRRAAYSASTKRALVDAADDLFTALGYAATSLDAVVAGARVTKGALYHHFTGKQAIFEAVFERVEDEAAHRIQRALRGHRDPWDKAREGLRAFLAVVQEPRYRRIVVQDGPAVLGYERFREQEERSTFATVVEIVRSTLTAGGWELDEPMVQTYAQIFFGALSSAGASVAAAADPEVAARRVEAAIGFLLTGVQGLVEAGVELPDGFGRAAGGDPAEETDGA
ncbi:TetR/AcrR family transcriptional regulator [Nocardioides sp. YIM 152588]|uniref:TetR/AcrR family transcriptional regulator n=1 Tax=Nocardioides sp. YIM 152588 TaxID=3158259 RepID=UPI0032E51CC3